MPEYLLPDVGEGLTEAEIVSWRVKVGDVVAINDIVVEIETAKSLVELPTPYAGTVGALLVPEGETVAVGTPIIRVGEPDEAPASSPKADSSGSDDDSEPMPTLVGYGPRETGAQRRPRRGAAAPVSASAEAVQEQVQEVFEPSPMAHEAADRRVAEVTEDAEPVDLAAPDAPDGSDAAGEAGERPLAKPLVRKVARDLGVDLATVTGSGPRGIVTKADVEAAASQRGASQAGSSPALAASRAAGLSYDESGEVREPVKGVRKMMAAAMVQSAFSAPHVSVWVTVDVTRTMELVKRLKDRRELREVKVSPLVVLARAVVLALRRTPEINSTWDEAAQEVVTKSYVNLGIAAATSRGLVVPNLKGAQDLSLPELAAGLAELTRTARDGRTTPSDMAGGTFTITNIGVLGVDGGTPIINPGESAILAFGQVRKQPWVVGDSIEVRQVTTLALSFDHRHIDGATGSHFLADVAGLLEDPATSLLF